eukprot:snap_masked-scaffold_32-processed-gene-3.13-mRNA-1 protein AED:1.00 eAED:1.00 QI:0/0/0/0/1/1/2/0/63
MVFITHFSGSFFLFQEIDRNYEKQESRHLTSLESACLWAKFLSRYDTLKTSGIIDIAFASGEV